MYPKHYFDLFRPEINPSLVFVGMSFAEDDQKRWHSIIKPAIKKLGLTPYRVDVEVVSSSIVIDIIKGINNAKFLLFDVSSNKFGWRNGNVMYELGLAHSTRLPEEVLIIRSDNDRLLFDVSNIRVHNYDLKTPEKSFKEISNIISALMDGIDSTKKLVINKIVSLMDEVTLSFISSQSEFDYFSLQNLDEAFEMRAIEIRTALRRLLEFGLIRLLWSSEEKKYAYVWTPLGREIINFFGFNTEC